MAQSNTPDIIKDAPIGDVYIDDGFDGITMEEFAELFSNATFDNHTRFSGEPRILRLNTYPNSGMLAFPVNANDEATGERMSSNLSRQEILGQLKYNAEIRHPKAYASIWHYPSSAPCYR